MNEGISREGLRLGNLGKLKVWRAIAEPAHKEETDCEPTTQRKLHEKEQTPQKPASVHHHRGNCCGCSPPHCQPPFPRVNHLVISAFN